MKITLRGIQLVYEITVNCPRWTLGEGIWFILLPCNIIEVCLDSIDTMTVKLKHEDLT